MNDFTKEELRLILYYHPHGNDSLCHKVREMIDNYCEHVWDEHEGHLQCQKCNLKKCSRCEKEKACVVKFKGDIL